LSISLIPITGYFAITHPLLSCTLGLKVQSIADTKVLHGFRCIQTSL